MRNFGLVDEGVTTCKTRQKNISGVHFPVLYRIREYHIAKRNIYPIPIECRCEHFLVTEDFGRIKERIETIMDYYIDAGESEPCYFIVHELPQWVEIAQDEHLREWVFYSIFESGESMCCYELFDEKFMGRPADKIIHNVGDRVTVVVDDKAMRGIVLKTPPTDEEVRRVYEQHRQHCIANFPEVTRNLQAMEWAIYKRFDMGYEADAYEVLLDMGGGKKEPRHIPSSRVLMWWRIPYNK